MMTNNTMKKQNSGFTLIELIITVSIVAILVSIAAPSFRTMLENNRATTTTNELVSALLLARSEALKRRNNISICTSTDQATCAGNGERDFSKGWIVFQDCDGNGSRDTSVDCDFDGNADDDEAIIKVQSEFGQLDIAKNGAEASQHFFTYTFTGRSSANTFNITKKDTTTPVLKQISVARTGHVKTCSGACP